MRRFIRHVLPVVLLVVGAAPLGVAGAASASASPVTAAAAAVNPAPAVQPGIREWRGGHGEFRLTPRSRIVLGGADAAELRSMARTFATDLGALAGRTLPVVTGTPKAGDIALRSRSADAQLGAQGYVLNIGNVLEVDATGDTGVFYATQTIEQAIKLDDRHTSIPRGTARDWPDIEQRAQMLDVGRKFFSIGYLKTQIREMAWQKLTTFHLHLTDWEGFRIQLPQFPGLAAADSYSPADLRELQDYARTYHVDVIPEIDLPGHATPPHHLRSEAALRLYLDGPGEVARW